MLAWRPLTLGAAEWGTAGKQQSTDPEDSWM